MSGGWGFGKCDNGIHLCPVNDLEEHMDEDCKCGAVQNEDSLWVHKSFDGREAFEDNERKPS